MSRPGYAELQVTSNFSFLRGASHAQELVAVAARLGHRAIAVTDHNTLAGIVRAHVAAKAVKLQFIVGARIDLQDAPSLLIYPTDREAYGRLSRLITIGRRRAPKGECHLTLEDVLAHARGQITIALPPERGLYPTADGSDSFATFLSKLAETFPGAAYLAGTHRLSGIDRHRIALLAELAERCGTPLVATNDVQYHDPTRKPLHDILTCIREHCTIDNAGLRLAPNPEQHLKSPERMALLFEGFPDALARTVEIAERCRFSLDELRYEYPIELTTEGRTPQQELERLTWIGARERYPDGIPEKVRANLVHELALIAELEYAPYFLTVHDIVRFARSKEILCQGRGSAANSSVCYCLAITAVDPAQHDLLFERFISAARNEPPDIDVDFEHERREEVIQYIYGKYTRERAGLAATVIRYRARSAIREVGKAMGLSEDVVGGLAKGTWGWSSKVVSNKQVGEIGLDPTDGRLAMTLALAQELIGFPRHLSQHVGGFVMTRRPLADLVPIENAAMVDRTVIEWDKDDLQAVGLMKVDVLALGMLTCVRKAFDLIKQHYGKDFDLASVPRDDAAVYDMLCHADSVGVFQVESRAQMTMLPRLKPRCFYDLVIEVAIVRPGPIQGDMVHPYLRRRNGEEAVTYASPALKDVLGKTLGVPLFQEQAMKIAIVAAGFSADEADGLRRAMATFRHTGTIHTFRQKFIEGMARNGYDPGFAERCFNQIEGFGEYGFPESHAASFAQLAYVSAWIKRHYPAVFACALLNSQPMGFYAPAQIVRDARDHTVKVLPVDINHSAQDCTLEPAPETPDRFALRLGLRQVSGLNAADAEKLVAARGNGYADIPQLWRRAGLRAASLEHLANADAFRSVGVDRRVALWDIKALPAAAPLPLFAAIGEDEVFDEPDANLTPMSLGEHVVEDYQSLHLSLKAHPMALLRHDMTELGCVRCEELAARPNNRRLKVAGLVLVRQRPGTASGVIFATLEDETGIANIIVWPKVFEKYRRTVLTASLLGVEGPLQREGLVIHVIAQRLVDLSHLLGTLGDRDTLNAPLARADHVKTNSHDPRDAGGRSRGRRAGGYRSRDFH
ncbi:error-prone DNA polymerase [Hyphomicrobium sp. CS1BSMeth3]|uniref:error-prone DNA polymerase n=1 Tax=Hyphomicrobium sp. CS1BSMeth3 TaxID=1892844 RepID=UPI0009315871|nr:error-prone DNA polymerase [Hyphomicrobium sp. CS1BSMeth3]